MSVLTQAKYYYDRFYSDGVWNEYQAKSWLGSRYTDEKYDFLKKFYECLMNGKVANELLTIYIKDPRLSIREAVIKYNKLNPDSPIKENAGLSQHKYCKDKLQAFFTDEDMLNKIINGDGVTKKYARQLNEFIAKYGKKRETKKDILVNIPMFKKRYDVTDEQFKDFLRLIAPYCKPQVKKIQEQIYSMVAQAGYFNYIMSADKNLTDEEQAHKELVEIMLGRRPGSIEELLAEPENEIDPVDQEETEEPDQLEEASEIEEPDQVEEASEIEQSSESDLQENSLSDEIIDLDVPDISDDDAPDFYDDVPVEPEQSEPVQTPDKPIISNIEKPDTSVDKKTQDLADKYALVKPEKPEDSAIRLNPDKPGTYKLNMF